MKRIHSYKFFLESQDPTLLKKPNSTSASATQNYYKCVLVMEIPLT